MSIRMLKDYITYQTLNGIIRTGIDADQSEAVVLLLKSEARTPLNPTCPKTAVGPSSTFPYTTSILHVVS
jgi:hypothetical protein